MRALTLLCFALAARADEHTQKLVERLALEADAFQKIAPLVVGHEVLHQRAVSAPPRFKISTVNGDKEPAAAWKEREIVSEYGFALFGGQEIHEVRQVTSVDGKRVAGESQAQEALGKLVAGNDDQRKKRALQQLEKYGLQGAATDFGQILLLFSRASVERYEITASGPRLLGTVPTEVFRYRQLDGLRALTVFRRDSTAVPQRLSVQGEIWVREADGLPVRITMTATDDTNGRSLLEEASVDYAMSEFGTLLPLETTQRELHSGEEVTENKFIYSDFHRFGIKP